MTKKVKFDIAAKDNSSGVFNKVNNSLRGINKTSGLAMGVMGGLAGALGIGAVVAGFTSLIKSSFDTGDQIAKTSDKLGIASNKLQELNYVAELTGVGTAKFNASLEKMNIRVSEAASGTGTAKKSFEALNLSARELSLMKPDEVFIKINKSLKEIPNQTERARHAYNIFGRAGVSILNIANEGEEGIRAMMQEAENLGLTFSRFDLAKFEMANDSMFKLQGLVKGVATKIAIELAPMITGVSDYLIEAATESKNFKNVGVNAMEGMAKGVSFVGDGLQGLGIIYKALEVGLRVWELSTISVFATILRTADLFKVRFNEQINETMDTLQGFVDKGSGLPFIGDKFKEFSSLIDAWKPTSARNEISLFLDDYQKLSKDGFQKAAKELTELTTKDWSSNNITKIFDEIKNKADKAAESIASNRKKLVVREDIAEDQEKKDPLKIKKELISLDRKRTQQAKSLISAFGTQKERLQNQKNELLKLYKLRDEKGNPFISETEFNQTMDRINDRMKSSSDSWKENITSFSDIAKDSFSDVKNEIVSMAQEGGFSLSKLGNMFKNAFMKKAISNTMNAGMGALFGGAFADGGILEKDKVGLVGENGAEFIAPSNVDRRIFSH
ncbi:hypothetical protein MJH12_15285, partial [bacterium]|nr:hypothetical protein [bacterium]